jgi:hypothetical protein
MARKSEVDKAKLWSQRLEAAEKTYKKWEEKYRSKLLWEYYLGHQWKEGQGNDASGNLKYTINMVFPTIETQLPSQLFYHPKFLIRPSPTMMKTPGSNATERASLQEDTLNSFVRDSRLAFKQETFLALLESYFRFGVVEVGYSGEWIDNPNAGKPLLKENSEDEVKDSEGKQVISPEQILSRESIYFKRIPASQFRVSANSHNQLNRCDWVAYFEWYYPEDLKRNKRYKNTTNVSTTGWVNTDASPTTYDDADQEKEHRSMVKVWKIYDLRAKKRIDYGEGNEKLFLEEPMELWEDGTPVVPLAVLKKHPQLDEFYPLPAVFNWISPQDELNETREMQKVHRKRFLRKFMADPSVAGEELAKWEQPIDGLLIRGKADGITPIADAPLDPTVVRNIPQTKDDFREISGISGEQRGIAQSETATQANIINIESKIRETKAKDQISTWLAEIGKLALYFIRKRMVLPFWIALNTDMTAEGAMLQAMNVVEGYRQIQAEDLDGVDTEVTVDVASLAPVNESQERQDWIQALQIVTDPVRAPMLLASDVLLRKTMGLFNIRNEKEIQELKSFGVQTLQMLMMSQAQAQGGGASGAQGSPGPGPTPTNEETAGQIQRQLPGGSQ